MSRHDVKAMGVDVSGADVASLVAEDGGDGGQGDYADWADTRVHCP